MGTPFLGEVKMVSFNFAPQGWALCNGQQLPINQNQALFSLFGTTYGGNGQTTFALPDLRGRVPLHFGAGFVLGQRGGEEAHTLTQAEMPQHTHFLQGSSTTGNQQAGTGNVFGTVAGRIYGDPVNTTLLNAQTIGGFGGSQPHPNMQPFLVLNFCVALQGVFPSQN